MRRKRKTKAEMAEIVAKRAATRAANQKREVHSGEASDSQAAYAFGFCQAWLWQYAQGTGLSAGALAKRVGNLLRHS